VEIYQTQIGKVEVGATVKLTADALPQPLHGTVTQIGLEVGRQTVVDADPAANTDARVVTVTAPFFYERIVCNFGIERPG